MNVLIDSALYVRYVSQTIKKCIEAKRWFSMKKHTSSSLQCTVEDIPNSVHADSVLLRK